MDLSYGRLSDFSCSELVYAGAATGSLEAIELEGNFVGLKAVDQILSATAMETCRLKYIGLANTNFSDRHFNSLLTRLPVNSSIASLNLSHNSLSHTGTLKDAMRSFMKGNRNMRVLDLSHNRLTSESTKAIYIGIWQNSTLFSVRLTGNVSACEPLEYSKLQQKLSQNRSAAKIDIGNSK